MSPFRKVIIAVSLSISAISVVASVRLTYPLGGAPTTLYWPPASFPIAYQMEPRVVNVIGRDPIDSAFAAWTKIPSARVTFRSDGIVEGAKTGHDGKNTIGLVDSLFKDQGFIALTTYWSDDAGRMNEADIQLDPAYVGTTYPAEQTIRHEVGHLLGLDHSGVLSSAMYPYVCSEESTTFDSDDVIAISNLYPKLDPTLAGATLTGRVTGNSGGVFAAQVVAVNDAGEPVATALTDASGDFVLESIPSGTYNLYAEPLDGPVTPANFAGVYHDVKVAAFPTHFASGSPMHIDAGKVYGNLAIDVSGNPPLLNAKWIGTASPDATSFSLYSSVVALRPGQIAAVAVGGDGFTGGMTKFTIDNPSVRRVSEFRYAGNYVYANFEVAPDAAPRSAVVIVTSGSDSSMLTGAVRIGGAAAMPTRGRLVRR